MEGINRECINCWGKCSIEYNEPDSYKKYCYECKEYIN